MLRCFLILGFGGHELSSRWRTLSAAMSDCVWGTGLVLAPVCRGMVAMVDFAGVFPLWFFREFEKLDWHRSCGMVGSDDNEHASCRFW